MSHTCPARGCTAEVPDDKLACPAHWHSFPKPLRNAIWRAWDHGHGKGADGHTRLVAIAVKFLNR